MSDFLIVGAGVNGLLLARELLASGASVSVVDRGVAAREASWAGGGIVSPLYPWRYPAAVSQLSAWAQAFYPRLAEQLQQETGIDVEYDECGLLILAVDDEQKAVEWAERQGKRWELWNADRLRQQQPELRPGFSQAIWFPDVANVRNPRLGRALRASVLGHENATLLEHTEVVDFEQKGGRIAGVQVRPASESAGEQAEQDDRTESQAARRLDAGQVIVCAGAWTGKLLARAGLQVSVKPVHGQMLLYRFDRPPLRSICLNRGRYLIPRRDGHLLVGSTLEDRGFSKETDAAAADSLAVSAASMLESLQSRKPIGHWAGLRPGAEQGVPFIGRLPGNEGLWINAGQFRNGLVLAPASARLLADLLLARQPELDPEPYDPIQRGATVGRLDAGEGEDSAMGARPDAAGISRDPVS